LIVSPKGSYCKWKLDSYKNLLKQIFNYEFGMLNYELVALRAILSCGIILP
jgi:hypothetical protein